MMSYVHDKIKQKTIKLHFIVCKKSFKVNNILETVIFKKKIAIFMVWLQFQIML